MKARTFLGLLLAINAGLAAALAWQLHHPLPAASLPPEEHADRVRLAGEPSAPIAVAATPAPVPKRKEAEPKPEAPAPVVTEPAPTASPAQAVAAAPASVEKICMRWGDFSSEQWPSARTQLQKRLGKLTIEESLNEDKAKYWVHIPPRQNLEAARQVIADLKEKGITDAFIIQDGSAQQFAVSLGLFSKKSMADTFLRHLRAKDIADVVSRPHPQSRYLSVLIQGIPADKRTVMESLAGGFEKTTLQSAKCPPRS